MIMINVGYGNVVDKQRVVAVLSPDSQPIKRLIQAMRDRLTCLDCCYGRKTRSVILLDTGWIILSAVQYETMANRVIEGDIPKTEPKS